MATGEGDPQKFSTTPHYDGYPTVLAGYEADHPPNAPPPS